jgi:hypothetical protein
VSDKPIGYIQLSWKAATICRKLLVVKRLGIALCFVIVAFGFVALISHFANRPPAEAKIIANFNNHRATYERLRDMLIEDHELLRVADWGIETDSGLEKPPAGRFASARYGEYLTLLKDLNAKGASRRRGDIADPCILVWASGFAGDTRHRSICWLTIEPENRVANLDAFEKTAKPRKPVFRPIVDGWYIWADF